MGARGEMYSLVPTAERVAGIHPQLARLCEAQNWRCCYCGVSFVTGRQDNRTPTREHVKPSIAGGSDAWDNLVAACRLCNEARGAMHWDRFLKFVLWKGRDGAARYAKRRWARIQSKRSQSNIPPTPKATG